MSGPPGPPYPPAPAPGSNAIGSFVVGAGAIGTIQPFDFWTTVISQYANSPRLISIIQNFRDAIDQTKNIDDFFDRMWNIYTAEGYGLDCWGTIVGVNRVLNLSLGPKYLGFVEGGTLDYDPFNVSPWYSGQKLTDNFIMTDDGFRVLILAKALSNICDGGIPTINRILRTLFGASGKCYVVDSGGMALVYKFEFQPSAVQLAILTQSGVMPTPLGVSYTVVTG